MHDTGEQPDVFFSLFLSLSLSTASSQPRLKKKHVQCVCFDIHRPIGPPKLFSRQSQSRPVCEVTSECETEEQFPTLF